MHVTRSSTNSRTRYYSGSTSSPEPSPQPRTLPTKAQRSLWSRMSQELPGDLKVYYQRQEEIPWEQLSQELTSRRIERQRWFAPKMWIYQIQQQSKQPKTKTTMASVHPKKIPLLPDHSSVNWPVCEVVSRGVANDACSQVKFLGVQWTVQDYDSRCPFFGLRHTQSTKKKVSHIRTIHLPKPEWLTTVKNALNFLVVGILELVVAYNNFIEPDFCRDCQSPVGSNVWDNTTCLACGAVWCLSCAGRFLETEYLGVKDVKICGEHITPLIDQ